MREILFRGKPTENEWVYGSLDNHIETKPRILLNDRSGFWNIGVRADTVGQFTGLTDKNGKRIFEGDIIKHHRHLWGEDISDIGVVFWNAGTCQFRRTSSQDGETPQVWQSTAEHYEIIGNIHDNPELLEVKQ